MTRLPSPALASQQKAFFDTFGFLLLRGALADDMGWITEEFAAVFTDLGVEHTGDRRSTVVPFIDQRPRLAALLDHPAIDGALSAALGDDWNYVGGDGNYYTGSTGWHPDGNHEVGTFAKLALYLDPVGRDTGALRVIPGSHRMSAGWPARQAGRAEELWGVAGSEVPSIALESTPGDVLVFHHNLLHSSWGGGAFRRMFTLNCTSRATGDQELEELRAYIAMHALFGMERVHTHLMRDTAPPARMRHLEQVIANEGHLAALARAQREAGTTVMVTRGTEA